MTFVVWAALGDTDEAVERTVTVLVIACPHALGLAIPLVIAISTAIAARTRASSSRTGSRSNGCAPSTRSSSTRPARSPRANTSSPASRASDSTDDEVLALAAAVEADSEHPLGAGDRAGSRRDRSGVRSAVRSFGR